jgi:ribonucleoside-diphosphate reductase alpha chain
MEYSDNAIAIYKKLYFNRDKYDKLVETHPHECHQRIAKAISFNEEEYDIFLTMLNDNIFRPNSPVLINAGGPKQFLSACYVLGLEDSMESIIECWGTCAKIYASGAGAGVPLTNLRRKDAPITFGGRACLTGDTILYNIRPKIPIRKQEKTIETIYNNYKRYGKLPKKIKCVIDDGVLGINEITNIIYNGIKKVYKITTKKGYTIKATTNHRFLGLKGWKRLDQFIVGSSIAVNGRKYENNFGETNHQWKGNLALETTARQRIYTNYPWIKDIKECMKCNQYSERIEIHHIDGIPFNNELDNLECLCPKCHQSEHAQRRARKNNNFRLLKEIEFDQIKSIKYVGLEKVYDIQMKKPYHNFIANGFVSHNSGPLSYTKVLDIYSETVKAGNKARRAANMGMLNYNHPDIFELINCKLDRQTLKNFNLSVAVPDNFMERIINDDYYEIELIDPKEGIVKHTSSKELWDNIIENVWKIGDPGLAFIDRINQYNPFFNSIKIECTNPCGEVPLWPWTECVIGSINVAKFYGGIAHSGNKKSFFDWDRFEHVVRASTIFLDNCIDKTMHPNPRFKDMMLKYRPIGLGIMGLADLFVKMEIPYDSEEALKLFDEICFILNSTAIETSIKMCKKGKTKIKIPKEDKDQFEGLLKNYTNNDELVIKEFRKYGIRNCTWTCIAPTGSIALSADCSYSFEPLSAIVWQKELAETHKLMTFINPDFEKWVNTEYLKNFHDTHVKTNKDHFKNELYQKIIKNNGSVQKIEEIPKEIQNIFKCAHDISPYDKINMQAKGQKWISMAISSTCNVPENTTQEEISNIYKYAWEKELKGITVYRDKSQEWQPINFGQKDCKDNTVTVKADKIEMHLAPVNQKIERPIRRTGETYEIKTPHGRLYATFNRDKDKRPLEVFLRLGKSGTLENLLLDTISRLVSKNLQNSVPHKDISSLLRGIKGDFFRFRIAEDSSESIAAESIIDAVGIIMEYAFESGYIVPPDIAEGLKEIHKAAFPEEATITFKYEYFEACPECGQYSLKRDTGCRGGMCTNPNCFYTNCG